jgi:hypothetical protein
MQGRALRYRYEDAFFLENPPRGRFEVVLFTIHDLERIDADGRYPTGSSLGSSGRIFFGLDEETKRMIYHQVPPEGESPVGLFVQVKEAAVYKNWSQYPQTHVGIDCITDA